MPYKTNNSVDIDELIRQSKANSPVVEADNIPESNQASPNVTHRATTNSAPVNSTLTTPAKTGLVIEEDTVEEPKNEYTGPGIVMSNEERVQLEGTNEKPGVTVSELKPDTMNDVKKYMREQDEEIAKLKATKEKMEAQGVGPTTKNPQNVVNIYIDKAQVGEIALTPEQQRKVEMANKIVITETTELKFKTLKLRKPDSDNKLERKRKDSVIKKAFERTMSPFVALGSGYLGKMGNCSVGEIMRLGRNIDSGRNLTSELERWSLLYDKMRYCSIGKFESFDDFLKNTAYTDYDNLQFALIVATFPADTTLQFTCPQCKTPFNVTVKNRDLLRADLVDQNIADTVHDIVTADTFIERAKEVHENALFNQVKRISVDDENSILLDLYVPSAYDAIHRVYEQLTNPKKDEEEYDTYANLVQMIKYAYILDMDEDGESVYNRFDDVNDIFEIVSHFTEDEIRRIGQFTENSYLRHQYYYGIKDVVCPNEKCKHHLGEYTMSMDALLFHKVRPQQQ